MKNLVVEIEKMDHFGRGIGKVNGKTIFIENALIGEIVEAMIIKEKKNFMEGKTVKYIKKSVNRVDAICPYFTICGGCDVMHLTYDEQLKYKENKLKEILKKFANFENVKNIVSSNELYYRNKVTLQVKETIGYFKKKSYNIIPIDKCLIADKRINDLIKLLKNINLFGINQIVIRTSYDEIMVVFHLNEDVSVNIASFDIVDTIISIYNKKQKILKGKGYITTKIGDLNFKISPTSFFQVNNLGMELLYNKVVEYGNFTKNDMVLDLYCGTGTIGIFMAQHCKNVFGIEINDEAISDALINKKINNIENIDFKAGDVGTVLKETNFYPNVIVVDPPRAGLDNNAINKINELKPDRLIYVSCDPVTLARDLNILKEKFNIIEVTPVDMFPNTYHVESVALLKLK